MQILAATPLRVAPVIQAPQLPSQQQQHPKPDGPHEGQGDAVGKATGGLFVWSNYTKVRLCEGLM